MGIIYKYTNLVNGKVYIGQTIQELKERHSKHISVAFGKENGHGYNYLIHKAFRKYGVDNFSLEVIDKVDNTLLNEKEREYIALYNSYEKGYNMTPGGESKAEDFPLSAEEKEVISKLFEDGVAIKKIAEQTSHHYRKIKRTLIEELGYSETDIENRYLASKGKATRSAVYALDTNKEVVSSYSSIKEASQFLGISTAWLSKIVNSQQKFYKDKYWVKKMDLEKFLEDA